MGHFLENIYPFVPVWAQNAGVSLYGLAYRRERLGPGFDESVEEFKQRERCSPQQMEVYLESRLRQVLALAFDQCPYYRESWRKAGLTQTDLAHFTLHDLRKLPVTPKAELRASPERFVAGEAARKHRLRRYYSSGSTGTPVTIVCTSADHRRFIAAREVRSFAWAGTSIRKPRAMMGGRSVVPRANSRAPYYRYNATERQVYFSAYHLSPANIRNYIEGFNRYRPAVLTGYAYSYYILAQMMLRQSLALDYQPDALVLSSEKLTDQMKSVITRAFQARAYEEYGAVENCVLATECEKGSLHVSPDFGIVEIVDDDGNPLPPGHEGRMVCTGLQNVTQPLIRYEIGDIATWSADQCGCGRDQLPTLKEVVGRIEDAVVGPDGRELVRFHGIFVELAGVLEGQVVQKALDLFQVRVVTTEVFNEADENLIRARFHQRLGKVRVEIECVEALPRTERGKFRSVISELTPEQRAAAQAY